MEEQRLRTLYKAWGIKSPETRVWGKTHVYGGYRRSHRSKDQHHTKALEIRNFAQHQNNNFLITVSDL